MLYTKTKLKDGTTVNTEIRPDNTFTHCCECGKEIQVCLNRLFRSDCTDPIHAKLVCSDCTKKKMKPEIDPELLLSFMSGIAEIGFAKEILSVYDRFGIDDLSELKPENFNDFTKALITAVSHAA